MSFLCGVHGGARKASKYAAILALGAMDPVEANRKTAYTALQEFVTMRRALLERQASSTAAGTSAAAIHEHPEFVLPYLVQVPPFAIQIWPWTRRRRLRSTTMPLLNLVQHPAGGQSGTLRNMSSKLLQNCLLVL